MRKVKKKKKNHNNNTGLNKFNDIKLTGLTKFGCKINLKDFKNKYVPMVP